MGILYGEHVIALRPVTVESSDYALREYGATADDLRRAAAKAHDEIEKDRKAGHGKTQSNNRRRGRRRYKM